ncbi:helix-turn-helix domain-containing protein [Acetobacterium bakii]|uniref:helix-turn-helix domain-containing protein n=1 Tax=Acetobacterium bakii TaxID=52689 RepID=UPI0006812C56|nr:helix-turn-helix transcriptional regulator [Acetobacterium bakii]
MGEVTFAGYDSVFATRLRELMSENGTTQKDLAGVTGITRQAISQYMDGSIQPNIEKLYKICNFFKVSAEYLLGLSGVKSFDLDIKAISEKTGLSERAINKIVAYKNDEKIKELLTYKELRVQGLSELLSSTNFQFLLDNMISSAWYHQFDCEFKEYIFKIYCDLSGFTYDDENITIKDNKEKDIEFIMFQHEFETFYKHFLNIKERDNDYEIFLLQKRYAKIIDEFYSNIYDDILKNKRFIEMLNKSLNTIDVQKIEDKFNEYKSYIQPED